MLDKSFTRDRQTVAAICAGSETLLAASSKSTQAAPSVAPWIMCAVDAKSGSRVKPFLCAAIPVYLLIFQVRVRGVSGCTP